VRAKPADQKEILVTMGARNRAALDLVMAMDKMPVADPWAQRAVLCNGRMYLPADSCPPIRIITPQMVLEG